MDINVVRFRRRLSDQLMFDHMVDLLEEEMDNSDPCNYLENPEEWKEMILEGTTYAIWFSYYNDELFDYFKYDKKSELYKVIHNYCSETFSDRIEFVFEDRIDGCD